MANETAKRDDNRIPVVLGTGNDADAETLRLIVDPTTKRLLVESLTEADGHGSAGDGTTTVDGAGTRVQMANITVKRVFIQASMANSGIIVVGGATCVAAEATRRGIALFKNQGVWLYINNLNLLYLDSTEDGDKAHYYYEV